MKVESSRINVPVWLDYFALVTISTICTQLLASNWVVRLSQAPFDESCVAHSLFFANRSVFCNDVYFATWSPTALSSIINWLPALLYKFFKFPPFAFFVTLTFLQNLLLPLSLYCFSKLVTKSRFVSLLTAGFVMLFSPHHWNFALIGGLNFLPYANWVALPLLIFCLTSILKRNLKAVIALLLLSSTIHPVMSTICSAICCLFLILDRQDESYTRIFQEVALLAAAATLPSLLSITISTRGIEYLADHDRLKTLLSNQHVAPWNAEFPYGVSAFTAGLMTTLSLSLSSFAGLNNVFTRERRMLIAATVVTWLTLLTHILAVLVQVAPLLNMINTRSSIIYIVAALPYSLLFLCRNVQAKRPGILLPSIALFTAASPLAFAAEACAAWGIKVAISRKKYISFFGIALQVTGFFIALYVLLMRTQLRLVIDHIFSPQANQVLQFLIADAGQTHFYTHVIEVCMAGLVFVLFGFIATRNAFQNIFESSLSSHLTFLGKLASLLLLFMWCIESSYGQARVEVNKSSKEYANIQIWAKEHTLPCDNFVLLGTPAQNAWRGVAERPVVSAVRVSEVYKSTTLAQQYNSRLQKFYDRKGIKIGASDFKIDSLKRLTANDWLNFAKEFKAQYLVTTTHWPNLQLPIAKQNSNYLIYRLTDSDSKAD